MATFTGMVPQDWATAIAAQLGEVGIIVDCQFPEIGKYMQDATSGWDGLMCAAFFGNESNPNDPIAFYFKGFFYGSMARPPELMTAIDAALATKEPDAAATQNTCKILFDNMTLIPWGEQTAASFYQLGVHDEAQGAYPGTTFVAQYTWLDPELR
jgi:ABC-type transport system substrate-binding protein